MKTDTRDHDPVDPATEDGFRRLWDAYEPDLLRFARRRVSNVATAEDVVQDAYLRAWRRGHTYDAKRGTPRAWLLAILRNVIVDHARAAGSRPLTVSAHADPAGPDDHEQRLAALVVADALQRVNQEHREAIIENYYRDLPYREIAHRAGLPLGTVRSRLHYALKALSRRLEELGYEEP